MEGYLDNGLCRVEGKQKYLRSVRELRMTNNGIIPPQKSIVWRGPLGGLERQEYSEDEMLCTKIPHKIKRLLII